MLKDSPAYPVPPGGLHRSPPSSLTVKRGQRALAWLCSVPANHIGWAGSIPHLCTLTEAGDTPCCPPAGIPHRTGSAPGAAAPLPGENPAHLAEERRRRGRHLLHCKKRSSQRPAGGRTPSSPQPRSSQPRWAQTAAPLGAGEGAVPCGPERTSARAHLCPCSPAAPVSSAGMSKGDLIIRAANNPNPVKVAANCLAGTNRA